MPVASDRTVLVTGATSGIGWETARLLAGQGCHVPPQAHTITGDGVEVTRPYIRLATYAQSQLALTVLARASLPEQAGCSTVSMHPGICETSLRPLYAIRGKLVSRAA